MASTCREVCEVVRKFYATIPPEKIDFPVELLSGVIPSLEKFILNNCKFQIEPKCKSWGSNSLKGILIRRQDSAEVLYSGDLNTCWRRFVICKELAHLLIDTEHKHFTRDPVELVQQLIAGAAEITPDGDDILSEKLAVITAVEILAPWHLREKLQAFVEAKETDLQIAEKLRIPQTIVNFLVRTSYWKISQECNEEIN